VAEEAEKYRLLPALPIFEIAKVFVRFDHVASIIVNENHSAT
jgi:hypothetical protein